MSNNLGLPPIALRRLRRMISLDAPASGREDPMAVVSSSESPSPDRRDLASERSVVLIHLAKGGNDLALNTLFDRYRPRLVHWATGRLPFAARAYTDTQDLVQSVLIAAWNQLPTFDPRHNGAFQANLRTILKHKIIDATRKGVRTPPSEPLNDEEWDYQSASPLDLAITGEERARYERAFELLTEEERNLIFLRIELGFGYQEIADVTGKPSPDAARMAVKRAVMKLSRIISNGSR